MGRGCRSSNALLKKILKSPGPTLYFDKTSKKFVSKILTSSHFTDEEKKLLSNSFKNFINEEVTRKNKWTRAQLTHTYLNYLTTKYPHFRPLTDSHYFEDLSTDIDHIIHWLPNELPKEGPYLFGNSIRLNKNHRTSLMVDLKNGTVEFYNSFGSDSTVKNHFLKLRDLLTKKYGKPFTYTHPTKNSILQRDSYMCGIWACLFAEERIKQGTSFDPSTLPRDLNAYRYHVFSKSYKMDFYGSVGQMRFDAYEKLHFPMLYEDAWVKKFKLKWCDHFEELMRIDPHPVEFYYYQCCKTGVIPAGLVEMTEKALSALG